MPTMTTKPELKGTENATHKQKEIFESCLKAKGPRFIQGFIGKRLLLVIDFETKAGYYARYWYNIAGEFYKCRYYKSFNRIAMKPEHQIFKDNE